MFEVTESLTIQLPAATLAALRADAAARGRDAASVAAELVERQYHTDLAAFAVAEEERI